MERAECRADSQELFPVTSVEALMTTSSPPKPRWLGLGLLLLAVVVIQWPSLREAWRSPSGKEPVEGVAWRTSAGPAFTEAQQSGKPVLLVFTAGWCPPCQVMKREVWTDSKVREAAERSTVPVLVDIDVESHRDLVEKYQVQSIPTLVLVDAQGEVVRRAGFLNAAEAVPFLQEKS